MATIDNCIKGVWRMPMNDATAYGPYFEMTHHVGWNTVLSDIGEAADAFRDATIAFFTTAVLNEYLSQVWNGQVQLRYYDLSEAHPTAVHLANIEGVDRGTANALPPELALVVTQWCEPYTGAGGPVTRRQSLQNRFYMGPWNINAVADDQTGRPDTDAINALVSAFDAYYDVFDGLGIDNSFPVVASPKKGSSALINGRWVDNDWDQQRRRSLEPSEYQGNRP